MAPSTLVLPFIVRKLAGEMGEGVCLHICSENNFPTAAGLASSAAGYACLGTRRQTSLIVLNDVIIHIHTYPCMHSCTHTRVHTHAHAHPCARSVLTVKTISGGW